MSDRKIIEPKQVIVVRKDLNMSPGKFGAQVSHASLAPILHKFNKISGNNEIIYTFSLNKNNSFDVAFDTWLSNRFTKVIVYVKSEQALLNVFQKAKDKGLPVALIQDAGFTEFNEPTYTCVGIGPAFPDAFNGVTSKLRLLQGEIIFS